MPEPDDPMERVRWWSDEASASKTARDEAVRAAVSAGHSLRAVAEAAGLSHAAIARIVKR